MHLTAESDSAVCITPLSQTLQCASHRRVRLRGVHHTAESCSVVCITPPSLTPQSQYLPSVCFDSKFYKCNFSVTPEDINVKNVLLVKNSLRNLFYFRRFFCKTSLKEKTNMKKQKNKIFVAPVSSV